VGQSRQVRGHQGRLKPTTTLPHSPPPAPPQSPFKRTASAASTAGFAPLADFLESVPSVCPHELFTREENDKVRASQARPEFSDASHAIVTRKENAATETAALIIPAVGNNKLRHETLQRFMLANDSVTLAVEIPIWLTETDIEVIERDYAIELAPKTTAPRKPSSRPSRPFTMIRSISRRPRS
jgi:hypothetical protein